MTAHPLNLLNWPHLCRDFSWSPGGNIIAFWVPEDKDIPARVTLMQLPTRQEIRVRNLFNVVDCKLHWQKNGDYLCVKVDRTPKGTQVCTCPCPGLLGGRQKHNNTYMLVYVLYTTHPIP